MRRVSRGLFSRGGEADQVLKCFQDLSSFVIFYRLDGWLLCGVSGSSLSVETMKSLARNVINYYYLNYSTWAVLL